MSLHRGQHAPLSRSDRRVPVLLAAVGSVLSAGALWRSRRAGGHVRSGVLRSRGRPSPPGTTRCRWDCEAGDRAQDFLDSVPWPVGNPAAYISKTPTSNLSIAYLIIIKNGHAGQQAPGGPGNYCVSRAAFTV